MENDEIKVYLKITGFGCTPDDVSDLLDVTPSRFWRKGEQRHPKAKLLHEENGWMLQSSLSTDFSVRDQLLDLLKTIEPKKSKLFEISEQSDIAIYCSIYSAIGRPDLSFGNDSIRFMSEIGASLDIDLYLIE